MENRQTTETIKLARNLVSKLEAAKGDFTQIKGSIIEFITALDEQVYVLGDGDLCGLAGDALQRRGKPISWAAAFAERHFSQLVSATAGNA